MWKAINNWWQKLAKEKPAAPAEQEEIANPCCNQPEVHIAFRGKSDDRMYLARNRQWQELRYYQNNGLRVFCAQCRRRLV